MRGKRPYFEPAWGDSRITPADAGKTALEIDTTALRADHPRLCLRITPADAGKTCLHFVHLGSKEDHPRGCGENCAFVRVRACVVRSPPRMRGKLPDFGGFSDEPGITPADAGKTKIAKKT